MCRIMKVIDDETIEIADYRCPEVIFKSGQNPPTLQDTKNEIEHLEWYCTFKDIINPFQMYEENKKLHSIIKEVREWAKKYSCQFTNDDGELVVSEISFNIQARPCDLFKILDKENK